MPAASRISPRTVRSSAISQMSLPPEASPMTSRPCRRLKRCSQPAPRRRRPTMPKITPCLWFDTEGEEAAQFYTSVFPNSKILDVARYGSAGPRPEGTVMTVSFELDGLEFLALNGGPDFTFSE